LVEHVFEKFLKNILKFFIAKKKTKNAWLAKFHQKTVHMPGMIYLFLTSML